jgi:hypothetical protein
LSSSWKLYSNQWCARTHAKNSDRKKLVGV